MDYQHPPGAVWARFLDDYDYTEEEVAHITGEEAVVAAVQFALDEDIHTMNASMVRLNIAISTEDGDPVILDNPDADGPNDDPCYLAQLYASRLLALVMRNLPNETLDMIQAFDPDLRFDIAGALFGLIRDVGRQMAIRRMLGLQASASTDQRINLEFHRDWDGGRHE